MKLNEILISGLDTPCESILDEEGHLSVYAEFFAKYASYMLGCGATCIRISKNLRRMGENYHVYLGIHRLSHPAQIY